MMNMFNVYMLHMFGTCLKVDEAVKRRRKRQLEAVHTRNLKRRQQSLVDQERSIVVMIDHVHNIEGVVRVVGRHSGQALAVDGVVEVLLRDRMNKVGVKPGDMVIAQVVGYEELNLIAEFERVLHSSTSSTKTK
jgi:tRNA A37 methylthiotransferase MiaB